MNRLERFLVPCMGLFLLASPLLAQSGKEVAPGRAGFEVRGIVVTPDGDPAWGAEVLAQPVCIPRGRHTETQHAQIVTTGPDGSFRVRSRDPECRRFRFTARQADDYWLPTGGGVFQAGENGSAPEVALQAGVNVSPVNLQLGRRGGKVSLAVFDAAVGSRIRGRLMIRRHPEAGRSFGLVIVSAMESGEGGNLLLPPGDYDVTVTEMSCGGRTLIPAAPPRSQIRVLEGLELEQIFYLDTERLALEPSPGNPSGEGCRP